MKLLILALATPVVFGVAYYVGYVFSWLLLRRGRRVGSP